MMNEDWKKAYEEGFAAGWKAAKNNNDYNYQNFPPVYYGVDGDPTTTTVLGTHSDDKTYTLNERQQAFVTAMSMDNMSC